MIPKTIMLLNVGADFLMYLNEKNIVYIYIYIYIRFYSLVKVPVK